MTEIEFENSIESIKKEFKKIENVDNVSVFCVVTRFDDEDETLGQGISIFGKPINLATGMNLVMDKSEEIEDLILTTIQARAMIKMSKKIK